MTDPTTVTDALPEPDPIEQAIYEALRSVGRPSILREGEFLHTFADWLAVAAARTAAAAVAPLVVSREQYDALLTSAREASEFHDEDGARIAALEAALREHRHNVSSLGLNIDRQGNPVHGGEYDRRLWAVLGEQAST